MYSTNDYQNPKWIRSNLCIENSTENFFRISDLNEKTNFTKKLCNFTDDELINLIKTVSSNINFSKVKRKVVLSFFISFYNCFLFFFRLEGLFEYCFERPIFLFYALRSFFEVSGRAKGKFLNCQKILTSCSKSKATFRKPIQ
jgi:hypothetical protein